MTSSSPEPRQILLVEDDPADADRMIHMLRQLPFRVSRASTHAEAMSASPPDVVLLDLNVPGADDPIRFVRDVADRFPFAAIVVCTGLDDAEYGVKAKAAGAQERLLKGTFDRKSLHLSIREAWAGKLRSVEDVRRSRTDLSIPTPAEIESIIASKVDGMQSLVLAKLRKIAPDTDVHAIVEPPVRSVFTWMRSNAKVIGGVAGWIATLLAVAGAYVTQLRDDTQQTRAMVEQIRDDVRALRSERGTSP